ncbi:F-box domain [Macleaya cordata]|uniref:F-box domain n=1 Tax=Macleaya cordata TaxID=56857 RepID=A0A200QFJ3_MACCD|nr:F-box domain [Macleaya cordata]
MENFLPEDITLDLLSRLPAELVLECRLVCKSWRTHTYLSSFADMHLRRQLLKRDEVPKCHNHTESMEINLLPTEVTLDIFSRLPAESILLCRRVCKTWQNLLNNFVDVHSGFISLIQRYPKSSSDKKSESIRSKEKYGNLLYYGEYNDLKQSNNKKTLARINHPPLRFDNAFVGSCNGLICLSEHTTSGIEDPVYICNPITREYINLPIYKDLSLRKRRRGFSCNLFSKGRMVSGFGYNLSTNEYKVVRIYYYSSNVGLVQVYTLGSGSGWRNLGEITYSFLDTFPHTPGVFVNGALHWQEEIGKIVAFDLADEKFRVVPLPPFLFPHKYQTSSELKVLGGCL